MKIATWNVERPKKSSKLKNQRIFDALNEINADILILTETNSLITPGEGYKPFSTSPLAGSISEKGEEYSEGENRVTIWSKYEMTRSFETYDSATSICVGFKTPLGELNIYGTVIGIYGNRDKGFDRHLKMQLDDWKSLSEQGHICIAGDFNISFSDEYYYTKLGRQQVTECFEKLKIEILTGQIPANIDHVAISESFSKSVVPTIQTWNTDKDKKVSDHIGICLAFEDV